MSVIRRMTSSIVDAGLGGVRLRSGRRGDPTEPSLLPPAPTPPVPRCAPFLLSRRNLPEVLVARTGRASQSFAVASRSLDRGRQLNPAVERTRTPACKGQ